MSSQSKASSSPLKEKTLIVGEYLQASDHQLQALADFSWEKVFGASGDLARKMVSIPVLKLTPLVAENDIPAFLSHDRRSLLSLVCLEKVTCLQRRKLSATLAPNMSRTSISRRLRAALR
jgi:hypothetical protein